MATTGCSTPAPAPTTIRQFPTRARAREDIPESDTDTRYIYNNIYIRAREDTTALVQSCFVHQLGYWPSTGAMEQLRQLMDEGAGADLVCAVLEYTAATAPKPSWAYARTVLRKQLNAGVRTAEAFNAACEAYYAARAEAASAAPAYTPGYYKGGGPKKVIEQQYSQRQYGPELDEIPADLLAAIQGG